jgi:RNA polymerase sigma-70 factor (ECF subfamily)
MEAAMRSELAETPTQPADEALLARVARGDVEAFHLFYRRHAGRVLAYARQIGRDDSIVEDVVQEVFTAVWTKAGTFRPDRGDAAGWLYILLRNKLVDHWRRHGGRRGEELPEDAALSAVRERNDTRLIVRQALSRVDPGPREAIEMAYFGGLTYEETAGRLDLPVGTLKSRIRKGLQTMREMLAADPMLPEGA